MQKACTIGIDTNMPAIGNRRRQPLAGHGKGITRPGNRCATERQCQTALVADHLDHVRIEQCLDILDWLGECGNPGLRVGCQVGGYLIDQHRWDHRLVTLYVDHDGFVRQP